MKVLIGTTNTSKAKQFEELLDGHDLKFYTLKDLGIEAEPEEKGKTPEENANIKARFYGQYFERVICNDSGLYFDGLPLEDDRQPGLNIRTPGGCDRLEDEEMLTYYTKLIGTLGGKVSAYYLDGFAVYNKGKVYSYMESDEAARMSAFYMVDQPSGDRHPGWPFDSISLNRNTLTYFVEDGNKKYDTEEENVMIGEFRKRLVRFLEEALEL